MRCVHKSPSGAEFRASDHNKMAKNVSRYELFQAGKRGREDVERELQNLIREMQTTENLRKLASALVVDPWAQKVPAPRRKLDFASFEEKLNKAKKEFFSQQSDRSDG
jgi:hypothetical protein